MKQIQFAGGNALKTVYHRIKNEEKIHVLRDIQVMVSSFKANEDEYAEFYPYCVDVEISKMMENSIVEVNYSPLVLSKGIMSPQARTMEGAVRLYVDKLPVDDTEVIDIDNLIWKEVEGA